jgi:hypothetical protein
MWIGLVDADWPMATDPAALTFLPMITKPIFRAEFKAGEGGKTAVSMARWVNTRGEEGSWSEITTVAAQSRRYATNARNDAGATTGESMLWPRANLHPIRSFACNMVSSSHPHSVSAPSLRLSL